MSIQSNWTQDPETSWNRNFQGCSHAKAPYCNFMAAQEAQCAVVVGSSTYPSQNGLAFRWRRHLIHRRAVSPGKHPKNRRPHPPCANPQDGWKITSDTHPTTFPSINKPRVLEKSPKTCHQQCNFDFTLCSTWAGHQVTITWTGDTAECALHV